LERLEDREVLASLGLAAQYNALVFGNFTVPTGSDTEGRVAVAGDATFLSNYVVGAPPPDSNPTGAQLPLDPTRDTLIVGGDISNTGGFSWTVNGNVVYQGSYTGLPLFNASGTTRQQSPILLSAANGNAVTSGGRSFGDLLTEVRTKSTAWGGYAERGVTVESRGANTLTLQGNDPVLNVFNLSASQWGGTDVVRTIAAPAGSTVLVNVSGVSINVSGGDLAVSGVDQQHVLLNFYQARTVTSTLSDIRASLLAPFASATFNGGNVEGNAIFGGDVVQDGAAEFHNFRFQGNIPPQGLPVLPPPGVLAPLPGGNLSGADMSKRAVLGSAMGQAANAALSTTPNFALFSPSSARQLVFTAVAQDGGGLVRVFDFSSGNERFRFSPFGTGFTNGIQVTTGDVNRDGVPDVIAATGAGVVGEVRVFDGVTGALIRSFQPFGPGYTRGVTVTSADFNGDSFSDVVVGSGSGQSPIVKVFDGATGNQTSRFLAFGESNKGGIRVATGDVNGDGTPDILATTASGRARLAGFNGTTLTAATPAALFVSFAVGPTTDTGGGWVTAGDINGDGFADVAVGLGAGQAPRVISLSGQSISNGGTQPLSNYLVGSAKATNGARVTLADLDGDGKAELLSACGTAATPTMSVNNLLTGVTRTQFNAFNCVYVG